MHDWARAMTNPSQGACVFRGLSRDSRWGKELVQRLVCGRVTSICHLSSNHRLHINQKVLEQLLTRDYPPFPIYYLPRATIPTAFPFSPLSEQNPLRLVSDD